MQLVIVGIMHSSSFISYCFHLGNPSQPARIASSWGAGLFVFSFALTLLLLCIVLLFSIFISLPAIHGAPSHGLLDFLMSLMPVLVLRLSLANEMQVKLSNAFSEKVESDHMVRLRLLSKCYNTRAPARVQRDRDGGGAAASPYDLGVVTMA